MMIKYLTLVILFTPVTLVNLFRSYNHFYRAKCITVSGFLMCIKIDSIIGYVFCYITM